MSIPSGLVPEIDTDMKLEHLFLQQSQLGVAVWSRLAIILLADSHLNAVRSFLWNRVQPRGKIDSQRIDVAAIDQEFVLQIAGRWRPVIARRNQ